MSFENQDVERKVISILKVLHSHQTPAGSRVIARMLKGHGVSLSERAIRYHLRITDERQLTRLVGNRDGRVITARGLAEINSALVKDKVGFAITKIEQLAFSSNFHHEKRQGTVPINVSLFRETDFERALLTMKPAFDKGYCVSRLVAVAREGEILGNVPVPEGKVGLATVCSISINSSLLKAGVPTDSKFSGILQLNNQKPVRFIEIIHYDGCSLDPAEIFLKAGMTSVGETIATGRGSVLANFREIPAICEHTVDQVLESLKNAGIQGVLVKGTNGKPVCETAVAPNKIGMILMVGLNPVAAAQEAGIQCENHSMASMINYQNLTDFSEVLNKK
jgi:repressor of nif and glnA expression